MTVRTNRSDKKDLRAERTKKALINALFKLLYTYSIEKLTINQICKEAKVNRITFYNHYDDKYELFNDILLYERKKVADAFYKERNGVPLNDNLLETLMKFIEVFTDECFQYKDLILSIANNEDNSILIYILRGYVEKSVDELLEYLNVKQVTNLSVPLLSSYVTGGAFSLVFHWLSHHTEYSKQDFLTFVRQMLADSLEKYYPSKK